MVGREVVAQGGIEILAGVVTPIQTQWFPGRWFLVCVPGSYGTFTLFSTKFCGALTSNS